MTTTKITTSKLNGGRWIDLQEGTYTATILQFDEPSQYGIKGGRISKLYMNDDKNLILEYDREWNRTSGGKHPEKAQAFYEQIINMYN